jgi:hypothetical protein
LRGDSLAREWMRTRPDARNPEAIELSTTVQNCWKPISNYCLGETLKGSLMF